MIFKHIRRLTWTAILAVAALPLAAAEDDPLKPELAYRYAAVDAGGVIEVDWAIEDGYYLYKKKLSFASNTPGVTFGDYALPEGIPHSDEFFGEQEIYRDRFYVSIPYTVTDAAAGDVELQIKSQGCADIGLCYPPQVWTASVPLVQTSAAKNTVNLNDLAGSNLGDFLPVDDAFRPYVQAIDGNTVEISFAIAQGYYLYKDKIVANAASDDVRFGRVELPTGKLKTDQYFGEMEVYYDEVFGRVAAARATPEAMDLDVELSFQGCAEDGICYPPATRTLTVSLPTATAVAALPADPAVMISEQDRLANLAATAPFWLVIATFFGAGLLLSFTPCVLPMVPILSGIIAGEGEDVSAHRGFFLALSYVLGMALVYTAAGVVAAAAGLQLQATFNQPWVLILFSGLFVVLALGMFGMYDLQMPSSIQSKLATVSGNQKSGTTVGAFVMGALSALVVTACVAPALIAVLTVMAQTGDMVRGGTALFTMSLGMGAPLLLVGAAQGKFLPKAGPWMVAIKNGFGFMMLGLAIWMLSRMLPGGVIVGLWGALFLIAGVYMGGLTTLTRESTGTEKLGRGAGLMAVIYGAVLFIGSLAGSDSMLRPLEGLRSAAGGAVVEHHGLEFTRIKTVADLDRELTQAAAGGKTVMLDFYADWCVSCIEMEEFTFTDAAVQSALANTVLLQADVTANDEQDQALLERFGVFGPPTIIFFGSDGVQRQGYEVVGFMKAADFASHVQRAVSANDSMSVGNSGL